MTGARARNGEGAMRNATRLTLAGIVVMSLAFSGCCNKFKKSSGTDPEPAASPGTAASADIDEETGLSHGHARVNRCIKCFNRALRISKSGATYLQSVRNGEPRKGLYPIVLSPYDDAIKLCDEAMEDKDPPIPELDQTLPAFVESVKVMTPLLKEMGQYYTSKEYNTDKYAKAKTLHATFKTEHDKFRKAIDAFEKGLDAAGDNVDKERIQTASANKNLYYHSLVFQRDAKALLREVTKEKPNPTEFARLKAATDVSYTAFSTYADGHAAETTKAFMYAMYKPKCDEFIETVRAVKGTKVTDADSDKILAAFNAMVDSLNRVKWRGL